MGGYPQRATPVAAPVPTAAVRHGFPANDPRGTPGSSGIPPTRTPPPPPPAHLAARAAMAKVGKGLATGVLLDMFQKWYEKKMDEIAPPFPELHSAALVVPGFTMAEFCSSGGCPTAGFGLPTPTCLQGDTGVAECSNPPAPDANHFSLMRWENPHPSVLDPNLTVWNLYYGSLWVRQLEGYEPQAPFIGVVTEKAPLPSVKLSANHAPLAALRPAVRPRPRPRPEPERQPEPHPQAWFETLTITIGRTSVKQELSQSFKPLAKANPARNQTKERKGAYMLAVPKGVRKLAGITEIDDAVNCMWKQLPAKVTSPRKKAVARANRANKPAPKSKSDDGKNTAYKNIKVPGRSGEQGLRVTLQDKVMDIYDHWETLNRSWTDKEGTGSGFARAAKCLVENHFQDKAIGGANQLASDPFAKLGGRLGLGPTF